jgi:recombinational DNA repair ATPase RecF
LERGELTLRGWKGFDVKVPLWPVTFLVGPNGSGKSSLLEALAVISHGTLREDLRSWLRG